MGCSQSSTEIASSPTKKATKAKTLSKSPQANKRADYPVPRSPPKDNKILNIKDTKENSQSLSSIHKRSISEISINSRNKVKSVKRIKDPVPMSTESLQVVDVESSRRRN